MSPTRGSSERAPLFLQHVRFQIRPYLRKARGDLHELGWRAPCTDRPCRAVPSTLATRPIGSGGGPLRDDRRAHRRSSSSTRLRPTSRPPATTRPPSRRDPTRPDRTFTDRSFTATAVVEPPAFELVRELGEASTASPSFVAHRSSPFASPSDRQFTSVHHNTPAAVTATSASPMPICRRPICFGRHRRATHPHDLRGGQHGHPARTEEQPLVGDDRDRGDDDG